MSAFARAALLALLLAGAGCAYLPDGAPDESRLVCRSDAECAEGQVCFADGCGDPGQNIVVEVTPNPKAGLHAQDFPVENLRPQQNLELFGPATLRGQVRREALPGSETTAYSSPVSVRVSGESLLIPGVTRRYEAIAGAGQRWLPAGGGLRQLHRHPPGRPTRRCLRWWTAVWWSLAARCRSTSCCPRPPRSSGWPGRWCARQSLLVDAELEVQALDDSLRPLSQRVPVARGTGEFVLAMSPSAAKLSHVLVQVTAPRTEDAVPQKTFTVDPRPGVTAPLELGDYGAPVAVMGRLVDREGKPVAGASVYVQGKVGGGGQFRSRSGAHQPRGPLRAQLPAQPPGHAADALRRAPAHLRLGHHAAGHPRPTRRHHAEGHRL